MFEAHQTQEARRQNQQGQGKPIISTEFQGYRFTAVGSQLYYAKSHKTFIDFLGDYIRTVLDPAWGNAELAKPFEERHQILQWYDLICALQKETMTKPKGEIQKMPITGLVASYYGLAYNLYLLQHNAELQEYLIQRLKQPGSFYAAYYETWVAAWFILAGFHLRIEDEQDSTRTHPEFIARRDGQSYSVEAKTRQPGKKHFDVGNQLYKALNIEAHYPRAVFIDLNVGVNVDYQVLSNEVLAAVRGRESKLTVQGKAAPPAHVFVTNQPTHLALNETSLPKFCLMVGFKIPDFGHGAGFSSYTDAFKARMKYVALNDVVEAMGTYAFPDTFDGEISEFAFGEARRRFEIGERLEVAEGVFMTLQSGIVSEAEHKAYLVVNDDQNQSHVMTAELSDAEIKAYKSHPESFFGRTLSVPKNTEDPVDLYTFFIDSHKETPREKLIELLKAAPDIEELKQLEHDELLYVYAERLTHGALRGRSD